MLLKDWNLNQEMGWRIVVIAVTISIILAVVMVSVSPVWAEGPWTAINVEGASIQHGEKILHTTCFGCHTPQDDHVPIFKLAFAGGHKMRVRGGWIHTANLTVKQKWTDKNLRRAVMECVRPDERDLHPLMPCGAFGKRYSEQDIASIILAIRGLKPVENNPKRGVIPLDGHQATK
jgi:mono/diheme cytochrome c family protein